MVDGNIVSDNGKVIFFSKENFSEKICKGNSCFICGLDEGVVLFNDEHIIPRWILKKYNLFGDSVSLPNGKKFKYGKYKISCCKDCNSLLGLGLEKKISEGFSGDFDASFLFFNKNRELIFTWICLLYIKTHLRDRDFKADFKTAKKISDDYKWEELHHTYCIARSVYSNVTIDSNVYGSMFMFECDTSEYSEPFDYIDLYGTGTVLIKLNEFIIICVINDSGILNSIMCDYVKKITGKLNNMQLRELYARVTEKNLRVIDKPKYATIGSYENNHASIVAIIPKKIRVSPMDKIVLGDIMYKLVVDSLYKPKKEAFKKIISEEILNIKNGDWTFLFDEYGNFLSNSQIEINDEDDYLNSLK